MYVHVLNYYDQRREDARLILFYKIINNLAKVPHEHILVKAYEGTRRKNNHKFRHIGVNTSQYRQSFSPKTIGAWNQLPYADSPTLESLGVICCRQFDLSIMLLLEPC